MRYIVSVLLFFIFTAVRSAPAEYKVMFSYDYPPFNFTNAEGKLVGFNIDILNAIAELYDAEISIEGGEWETINVALKNGTTDAIGGTHYPGSPDNNYIYTRSTYNTSHCFLYSANRINKFSIEYFRSLKEPVVALWKNDVLVHYILSINPATRFIYVRDYDELVTALDRDDVTCIFGQRVGSMFYAQLHGKDYVRPFDQRILERNMGFKVSKNAPELAKMLNNGMEVILANGKYQQIYDRWIVDYNKSYNDWDNYLKYIVIGGSVMVLLFLLLLVANRILQFQVRARTKDLQQQLSLNSQIMVELEKQKEKAEESDKMKSAFLANMSHEIRTPMNGILGFTELLKSADYSAEKQTYFIDIIQQSGKRMLDTINNIIDVSKLESGLEHTRIKEVDIQRIVVELRNFFAPEASAKGLDLVVREKNSSSTTSRFFTDEYKLNSILTNLIKNALKFTQKGLVQIDYLIGDKQAEFWVTDSGIGIAKEKQAAMFEQFVQADFSHSRGFEGSGLGLSIVKGYVSLLNGVIQMKSEPNKGTEFYVSIPNEFSQSDERKEPSVTKPVQQTITSKYKFLIAEDNQTSFIFLKFALKNLAVSILHARDGEEAVELARNNSDIDIILMDVKMPRLNGLEATKEIRKFNDKVFIIAQTAFAQESFKDEIREAGCDAYISKPVDKQKLIDIILQHRFTE